MRFRAKNRRDSAQDYIQWMKCIGDPVVRTDGRTRDHYVTTKISWLDRLRNFLSNGAPLTRLRAGSAISCLQKNFPIFCFQLALRLVSFLPTGPVGVAAL